MKLKLIIALIFWLSIFTNPKAVYCQNHEATVKEIESFSFQNLTNAIDDLKRTFPAEYDQNNSYLPRLNKLIAKKDRVLNSGSEEQKNNYLRELNSFKSEVLLSNPLLDFDRLLMIKRKAFPHNKKHESLFYNDMGFASNHECKSSLKKTGWQNELVELSPVMPSGEINRIYEPPNGGYIGEIDLHWNADKLLFTVSEESNWKLVEGRPDGSEIQQVTSLPDDVDCFDGCYLPGGKIMFNSTANFKSVPCWHGKKLVGNLYTANADGSEIRQVCFDQDHDFHPSVLNNGQVIYNRWDYTGISHIYLRQLMVMNPDGTGQRAVYGSNSWYPNALYFPKALPGNNNRIISIISGYHGPHKMGQLAVIDLSKGWHDADGMVKRISGKGDSIKIEIKDRLVQEDWPKFINPFPLSDKYFLVSAWINEESEFAIYLADIFDNLVELKRIPGYHLFEPVPVMQTKPPPVIPEKVDLTADEGNVYLHNVYHGPGLKDVPNGTVKELRIFAYNFGFLGMAGPDKIGYGGPWEAMQILGTVPVEEDGSAFFKVPANTPLAVQPLDEKGRAVQLMRSWFTVMPGETRSCVGCHENPSEVPPVMPTIAARTQPDAITHWYGPPRGFDFEREVQPVLDHYCTDCHNGVNKALSDFRNETYFPDYKGLPLSNLGATRLHQSMAEVAGGNMKYTPAYDELIKYIRRVNVEDDVDLLTPGEYYAGSSELIQLLKKGHRGVELSEEAWERLYTWIDLNAPCHGTWNDAQPVPDSVDCRRRDLMAQFGAPKYDPEFIPDIPPPVFPAKQKKKLPAIQDINAEGFPLTMDEAAKKQQELGATEKTIELAEEIYLELVKIPAGNFVMGSLTGHEDEYPLTPVKIEESFWMGKFEITNEQYALFDSDHQSKYYHKRLEEHDDKGTPLNGPQQPVVRVSWQEAVEFCQWLSEKTGIEFSLPNEAQWEYACRAGTASPLNYGMVQDDFTAFANVGDLNFSIGKQMDGPRPGFQVSGGVAHLALEGAALADKRYDDNGRVSTDVGSYMPNAWGLFDMHGNVAEWTQSDYKKYPWHESDGRNEYSKMKNKVVRGGSFFDRPENCRSAFRSYHPAWMPVFNVGFRVTAKGVPQISSN